MLGFVVRRSGRLAALVMTIAVVACNRAGQDEAAQVSVFLTAARTDNRMIFEARVDRGRVRDDMRDQFAKIPGVQDLQSQLGEGVGDGALDRMISPETVRRLEKAAGATGESVSDLRSRLRGAGDGRICLKDADDRCLMTFAKQDKVWKLVGLHAEPQSFAPPANDILEN